MTMTVSEFLDPLKKKGQRERVLAVMYFASRYEGKEQVTTTDIKSLLTRSRTPSHGKFNVPSILNNAGANVDSPGDRDGSRLWSLTQTGKKFVRALLDLPAAEPEIEHDVGALSAVIARVADAELRDYIEESITCLRFGALRASIVFLWSAAIRRLQQQVFDKGAANASAALRKHKPNCPPVKKIDDFAYVTDHTVVLAALDLGILDKHEKDTLLENLGLRNRCGHPGKFKPGVKKVSAFIEDVVGILF